jgi:alkanesulfonate monooxygenase SsuD/methylene tetrahydromethanopterin reductase-like flavin-dependent oxidoreductase (luciferase family)
MRYGFVFPGGKPTENLEHAIAAEAAGWDAVFLWEGVYHVDPWTQLSAIAMRTERIKLGTLLTPAPRRRPWVLGGQCVTLDQLSGGRVILSVGIGAFDTGLGDMAREEHDVRIRAEILDETIDLLRAMWSGEPTKHTGTHYAVDLPAGPKPVQTGGIPIWCVGVWPRMKSMRRTLRCEGAVIQADDDSPETFAAIAEWLRERRERPIDVIAQGTTTPKNAAAKIEPLADAGATWWIEADWAAGPAKVRKRIDAGPPRAS